MLTGIGENNLAQFRLEAKKLLETTLKNRQTTMSQEKEEKMPATDQVSLGEEKTATAVYDRAMKEVGMENKYLLLQKLVIDTLQEQGVAFKVATNAGEIDISTLTPEQAQDLVAEDGYFGVEQTSERIFHFAIGMAGNDTGKIETIRKGVETGFEEAEAAWGGKLPDISYQTRDAILEKLAKWYEEDNKGT